jgi:hypothetical protein
MFGIDVRGDASGFLCFRDDMKSQSSFAGTLRAVNFDDSASRYAARSSSRTIEYSRTPRRTGT